VLRTELAAAQKSGNRELARSLAQLAEAERKGDRELAARITAELSTRDENRKQVE